MKIELDAQDIKRIEMMAGMKAHQIIQFLKSKEVKRGPKPKQAQQKPKAKSAEPEQEGACDVDGQAADTGQLCL